MMSKVLLAAVFALAVFSACKQASSGTETDSQAATSDTQSALEKEHMLFRSGYADSVNQGVVPDTLFKGSSRREAMGSVGPVTVKINYGSPGKRGRVIWNGLVSLDQVWVSGSHWATALSFDADVTIAGTKVPAGRYAFYTIPSNGDWTLILNKNYDQHLADDYKREEDVLRLQVKPTQLSKVVERLTYEIKPISATKGEIQLSWDQLQVALPFEV